MKTLAGTSLATILLDYMSIYLYLFEEKLKCTLTLMSHIKSEQINTQEQEFWGHGPEICVCKHFPVYVTVSVKLYVYPLCQVLLSQLFR